MFQSFDAATSPDTGATRLADLRSLMRAQNLDGFLIPRADAHQGEYVVPRDQRLAWLTGFTGSAGFCAALLNTAGVFIDGRYRLQIRDQVDLSIYKPVNWPETQLADWLMGQCQSGDVIGFDPWLHTHDEIAQLSKTLAAQNIVLRPCANLVDAIWDDQPNAPDDPIIPHPIKFSGRAHDDKIADISRGLQTANHSAYVLTQTDSIAWLLNIRGTDLGQTPVALAFAIVHANAQVDLFVDLGKTSQNLRKHLGDSVTIKAITDFETALSSLTDTVCIDPKTCPEKVVQILTAQIAHSPDPTTLPKACKNDTELAGAKAAHMRDGLALVHFLAWLDGLDSGADISEIDIVRHLEDCRRDTQELQNISFDTICGSGPNGAIVHYRVTHDSNRKLKQNEVLLVDSGAQYQDGTTDITRTIAIGNPPKEAVQNATLVLKGMIAISRAVFPVGTCGKDIDALARGALWAQGKDYDHGTGHGVGSFLSVHEGPQGISKRATQAFLPGMIVSNEPGYYKENAYGIRIENLIYVREIGHIAGGDQRQMLGFETLTLAPIDRRMMDISQLSKAEINWLDCYHKRVFETLSPRVEGRILEWLKSACKPLAS